MSFFRNKDYLQHWYYNPTLELLLHCDQEDQIKVNQLVDIFRFENKNYSVTSLHPIVSIDYLSPNQIYYLITKYHNQINSDLVIKCLKDLEQHLLNVFKLSSKLKSNDLDLIKDIIKFDDTTLLYHKCIYIVAGDVMTAKNSKDHLVFILTNDMGQTYERLFKKEDARRDLDRLLETQPLWKRYAVCKTFSQILQHFYVFAALLKELHLTLAGESKLPEAAKTTLQLKDTVKRLAGIRGVIDDLHKKTPYILRMPESDHESQSLVLTDTECMLLSVYSSGGSGGSTGTINNSSGSSGGSSKVKKLFTLSYNNFTLQNQIYNDIKSSSNHLHLISESQDLFFKTSIAPINELLSIYRLIITIKEINHLKCDYCKLLFNQLTECSFCNIKSCILCTRNDKCIKCHLKFQPIAVKVRFDEGREAKLIKLETPDFLDFTSLIFEALEIDKGMKMQCKLQDQSRASIPLNSDINLHLALRSNAAICKMVNVSIMDPMINDTVPTINMSDVVLLPQIIGEGGGGSVIAVQVPSLGIDPDINPLVLKKFKLPPSDMEEFDPRSKNNTIARSKYKFKREASLLSNINSPYIVKMYAYCKDDTKPHELGIILERANLGTLNERFFNSWELNLLILLDICKALIDVHSCGYIFQDLKPENVLLFNEQLDDQIARVKLSDFGIATKKKKKHNLGHTGVSHTHGYTSPEHNASGKYNELIDIYGFGLLMFELLTKHRYQNRWNEPVYDWKDISDTLPQPVITVLKLSLKSDAELRIQDSKILLQKLQHLLDVCRKEQWQPLIHKDIPQQRKE